MDQNTKDMLDALDFIKERMATKDDLQRFATKDDMRAIVEEVVDEKLRPIHASLTEINRRLDTIEESYANLKGVTKEIDEIRGEVRAIQKHLGIERKIAA
jgi:spore coat protein CotH